MRTTQRNLGLVLISFGGLAVLACAACSTASNGYADADYYHAPDAFSLGPDAAGPGGADAGKGQPDAPPGLDAGGIPNDGGRTKADGGGGGGTCSPSNTNGTCPGKDEVCQSNGKCAAPLSALELSKHPLLISELQADPALPITDAVGEYLEIVNVTGEHILLDGLIVEDAASHTVTVPNNTVILASHAFAVFAASTDSSMNGGITGAHDLLPVTLNNGPETISILYNGTTIHKVAYPGTGTDLNNTGIAAKTGFSTQLDQNYIDAVEAGNSATPAWCLSTTTYASNNSGSPGAKNAVCQ